MGHTRALAIAFAIIVVPPAIALAEEKPVEIPLKEIWALDMPGTRDIKELGDGKAKGSLLEPLLKQIQETWHNEHGVAVEGEAREALQHFQRYAFKPPESKAAPRSSIPRDDGIHLSAAAPASLAFFTRRTDVRVQLKSIERGKTGFRVKYCFAPLGAGEGLHQLALIPVGKLPRGQYSVIVERLPADKNHLDAGFNEPPREKGDDVCGSFSFIVVDPAAAAADAKPMTVPLKDIWALKMPSTREIRELDKSVAQKDFLQPLLNHICDTWNNDRGLAVQGEGLDALRQFNAVEVDGKQQPSLTSDGPISLVFYTKLTGFYVHLSSVEKQSNRFTIRYHLVPHKTRESTQELALIPVGMLLAQKYVVRVERLPLEKEYQDQGYPEPPSEQSSRICNSFGFMVLDRR